MKAVIEGKTYNTDTATEICKVSCSVQGSRDFQWHDTGVYRTKKGAWFVSGRGGPMSMWSQPSGNETSGGSGVRVITEQEARAYMEEAGLDEEDFKKAGLDVEEG